MSVYLELGQLPRLHRRHPAFELQDARLHRVELLSLPEPVLLDRRPDAVRLAGNDRIADVHPGHQLPEKDVGPEMPLTVAGVPYVEGGRGALREVGTRPQADQVEPEERVEVDVVPRPPERPADRGPRREDVAVGHYAVAPGVGVGAAPRPGVPVGRVGRIGEELPAVEAVGRQQADVPRFVEADRPQPVAGVESAFPGNGGDLPAGPFSDEAGTARVPVKGDCPALGPGVPVAVVGEHHLQQAAGQGQRGPGGILVDEAVAVVVDPVDAVLVEVDVAVVVPPAVAAAVAPGGPAAFRVAGCRLRRGVPFERRALHLGAQDGFVHHPARAHAVLVEQAVPVVVELRLDPVLVDQAVAVAVDAVGRVLVEQPVPVVVDDLHRILVDQAVAVVVDDDLHRVRAAPDEVVPEHLAGVEAVADGKGPPGLAAVANAPGAGSEGAGQGGESPGEGEPAGEVEAGESAPVRHRCQAPPASRRMRSSCQVTSRS